MNPVVDYHALAPEIVLTATIVVVLIADLLFPERDRWQTSRIASIGVLGALIPVLTLASGVFTDNHFVARSMFGGAYVVDEYALVLKGFFLVTTYIVLLLSIDEIKEGDYYQGEFWYLLLSSVLGMLIMSSARDLISIFVALELISIPTFVLAGWQKHNSKSNEAAIKYYLIGVISSAVMLYGMSLIYGLSGTTMLRGIFVYLQHAPDLGLILVACFLTLAGFAFKISAVPFHFWAPDTYEGAPTPVTAFLSVASKAGGFVALLTIIFVGLYPQTDGWQPVLWFLAAASMTVGNLTALRQNNIVRMLAYSSIAQGGFILAPLAVAGGSSNHGRDAFQAVVIYLLIYGAMNLGAFAVVIAVARRTRSGAISSYAGLGVTSPALAVIMTIFLFSLAGVPPLAGWFAKFVMFRALLDAGGSWAVALAVIAAVNSVIAFFYYAGVARRIWFDAPAEGATAPRIPAALNLSIGLCVTAVVVVGVYPQLFARLGDVAARSITG
ncbi:MAG: proton-translocating NADH-quinone oxidoreductase, chain [Actinomycetia bacterium]|nr:proton-translocating NADH-quinone oxidoreductase, chain [Actinomycetes bacterium]